MVTAISTPQQALDARDTEIRLSVWIGGVLTDVLSASGQQGVDAAFATCKIVLPLPRPAWVTANAPVEVQCGHDDFVGTQFSGYVPAWEGAISPDGDLLTLTCDGWAARLAEPDRYDWEMQGPVSAQSVFVALCERKGVPSYISEPVTPPDRNTDIMLGGNSQIDDGKVIFKGNSSPLATFNRLIKPYGYRVFDTSTGAVRLGRVSGYPDSSFAVEIGPDGEPVLTIVHFEHGVHILDATRSYDVGDIVTYYDVKGATYEDAFGGKVPIRSIPTLDIADPLVIGGHRYREVRNSDLVRQEQADVARNVLEIDGGADAPVRWKAAGTPGISVGDVVILYTGDPDTGEDNLEASSFYWLMSMDWSVDDGGYVTTYKGWAGGGVALPSLIDRVTIPIQTPAVHMGDEYVGWYAQPSPFGTEKVWTITLPEKVSVANVRGWAHGANSQYIDGAGVDDLTVTKWAIWKAGTDRTNKKNKAESSGTMPPMAEDYELRRPYGAGLTWWSQFAINLRSVEAGSYDLVLTCGDNEGLDDFEVQQVFLECYGTVDAAIVGER